MTRTSGSNQRTHREYTYMGALVATTEILPYANRIRKRHYGNSDTHLTPT